MSKDREKDFDAFKDTGENYQTELWNLVIGEKENALASLRERLAGQDQPPQQLIAASDNPDELLNSLTTSYNAHGHSKLAAVKIQWTMLTSEHQRTVKRLAAANTEFEKEVQLAEVQEGSTWLLIYDNAEDINVLREFWPAGFHGAMIVTSQNPSISHLTANNILLRTLRPSEGASLIQKYLNRGLSEAASAEDLSRILGGHALAIVHFTGHVSRSQCLIEEMTKGFSKRLQSSSVWKTDRENISVLTRAYAHTLETVWNIAFQRLSSDANILLEWIAFLDPDQIPTDLFIEPSDNAHPGITDSGWGYWDSTRFNNAVEVLRERNLVERYGQHADDSLRTHRVLQRCILQRLDTQPDKRFTRFMEVVSIIRKAIPEANPISRGDRSQAWKFARYLPQIERLHSNFVDSEPKIEGSMAFMIILDDTSYYAMTQEDNSLSQKLAVTGIHICEDEIDSHPDNIEAKTRLPNLLALLAAALNYCGATGRKEALEIARRVRKLRQEELAGIPEEDWTDLQAVNYARAHNDLSWQLLDINKPEDAAPLFKVAIAIYQRTNNKLRLASVMATQTLVLAAQQLKDQVRDQGSAVKKTVEEMVGSKDALTLMVKFELASAYFTIGDNLGDLETAE
ncbi:unnamed protein product [Clonostachys solani]|uniref:DUF7779 domain-containing protein n=1 Tax=Clonostachys solani TaxID=160281 RepID=A0A9N9YVW2_9HYPO|nr:unnamed protein product [Clonostachys solani]